jgi:two-component system, chemotaxis family, protein-glutamate methylesterase/glutaminase
MSSIGYQRAPIKVLVVDDSTFMRNTLAMVLKKYPDIQVVGTARDGREALKEVIRLSPDVMTLDVNMPGMGGLEVLERIMEVHPLPVVMVSAFTQEGASETFQALARGAFDFIPKYRGTVLQDLTEMEARLYEKIKSAFENKRRFLDGHRDGKSKTRLSGDNPMQPSCDGKQTVGKRVGSCGIREKSPAIESQGIRLVVIGASTGGPQVLSELIRVIPSDFPASLLIIQHMPKFFTSVFGAQLAKLGQIPVREARHGDVLEVGAALIAPGDHHLSLTRRGAGGYLVNVSEAPAHLPYWPSIDLAMASSAELFGTRVLGLILTGMGQDGVEGCRTIKLYGGKVLVQDEASSAVFGMNGAVWHAGLADEVVPGARLGKRLVEIVGRD